MVFSRLCPWFASCSWILPWKKMREKERKRSVFQCFEWRCGKLRVWSVFLCILFYYSRWIMWKEKLFHDLGTNYREKEIEQCEKTQICWRDSNKGKKSVHPKAQVTGPVSSGNYQDSSSEIVFYYYCEAYGTALFPSSYCILAMNQKNTAWQKSLVNNNPSVGTNVIPSEAFQYVDEFCDFDPKMYAKDDVAVH